MNKYKKTIGITGASGALGKALTKKFKENGYQIIGFTHSKNDLKKNTSSPDKWINWECGKEFMIEKHLKKLDILILNHGIYNLSKLNSDYLNSIEINALSNFKIFTLFEEISIRDKSEKTREIWINTSEAEILPALNPSYEISKSLIGQLVTLKQNFLDNRAKNKLKIKKIIIGPFKSELNPIGILTPDFVANKIYKFTKPFGN